MKVRVVKTVGNEWPKETYSFDLGEYCCNELRNCEAVYCGEADSDSLYNVIGKLTITKCCPYPEGALWDEYEIDYCPFCGEKIQYNVECDSKKKLAEAVKETLEILERSRCDKD